MRWRNFKYHALFLVIIILIAVWVIIAGATYDEGATSVECSVGLTHRVLPEPLVEPELPEVSVITDIEVTKDPPPAFYELTSEERDIVERVVMSEAGGEGYDGQRLVVQCILNTALATEQRPDDVVLTPGQYASPAGSATDEVKEAVAAVFDNGDFYTDEPIRWFYAPKYCTSEWHESKTFVLEYGGHRFFK